MTAMPSKLFVSHASAERHLVDVLAKRLPEHCKLDVFHDPAWDASTTVSPAIVSRIRQADAVIVIDSPLSRSRLWVFFETHYAVLAKKSVYRFDPATSRIARARIEALDLRVFPVFSRTDLNRVGPLLRLLEERFFDSWSDDKELLPGEDISSAVRNAMTTRLQAGGYCLYLATANSLRSPWCREELMLAQREYPNQVLPVLLDSRDTLPAELMPLQHLHPRGESLEWFADDVVLHLYTLIGEATVTRRRKRSLLGRLLGRLARRPHR